MSMLAPYVALDLTDDKGFLCGKILADLGAEVIKVEKPGGDPSRLLPPFYGDKPDPEKSLPWFAYNQGKKSITLDLEAIEGRDISLKLVKRASWVIESFKPGYMERIGLGYDALARANPGIILTRISPFGQTGPHAGYLGPDLVVAATGGTMYPCGSIDRAPVRISSPQAYLYAAADAAAGSLIALHYQQRTGKGQVVDTSAQESMILSTLNARPWRELEGTEIRREGARRGGLSARVIQRQTWPCRDGFISFVVVGGARGAKWNRALVRWMDEEGLADDFLKQIDWDKFDMAATTQEFHDKMEERVSKFFARHTTEELYQGSIERGVGIFPVARVPYLFKDAQLNARNFWVEVEYPELGTSLKQPGSFARITPNPLVKGRRAPRVGEHNQEIFNTLGLDSAAIRNLKEKGII